MKRRMMLLGTRDSGVMQLADFIEGTTETSKRCGHILYREKTMVIPSSYLECPWMYKHLNSLQQQASSVLLILKLQQAPVIYPPNFAKQFRVPVVGIVSFDKTNNQGAVPLQNHCLEELRATGISNPLLIVDLDNQESLKAFERKLMQVLGKE